jgi:hypothetical protein
MNEDQSPKSTTSETPEDSPAKRAAVLQRTIADLLSLSPDDRRNVLETVATFFDLSVTQPPLVAKSTSAGSKRPPSFHFSEQSEAPTPKAFMFEKSPRTDVERVACLAYYLSHYRGVPHFKTKDITALNTESAHKPFSNTAVAVDNATKMGYLVPSVKGAKQLSASGERFVEALPDREAAKELLEQSRQRRGGGTPRKAKE